MLDDARVKSEITEFEREDALLNDVVATGSLKEEREMRVVLVGEFSIKVDRVDVERASGRVKVIGKALGLPVLSVVIGKVCTEGA